MNAHGSWICLFALVGLASSATAGVVPEAGDHARITPLEGSPFTGRLIAVDGASLALRLSGAAAADTNVRVIARTSMASLEVERRHGHTKAGAILGAVLGAFVSLVLVAEDPEFQEPSQQEWAFLAPVVGAGVGALVGTGIRHTRWEAVVTTEGRPYRDLHFSNAHGIVERRSAPDLRGIRQ